MEGERESPVTNIDNIAPRDGRRGFRRGLRERVREGFVISMSGFSFDFTGRQRLF
jgi:hypothetical protein